MSDSLPFDHFDKLPRVTKITDLQAELVRVWHEKDIDHATSGFLHLVSRQHEFNFRLWHEEDLARSPTASDTEIARVKRSIDRLNQSRNDQIEILDVAIAQFLMHQNVDAPSDAPLNTETPGSAIDRLSIMSLRLYHYNEQLERDDVDSSHIDSVQQRISTCHQQHKDLSSSLQELLDDLIAGRKQHKLYRQLKMYNDPNLNPSIYKQE